MPLRVTAGDIAVLDRGGHDQPEVQRVWAGSLLIYERPGVPEITEMLFSPQGQGGIVSWEIKTDEPLTALDLYRIEPTGHRTRIALAGLATRQVTTPALAPGQTTFELHATSPAGASVRSLTRAENARPTVALNFDGVTQNAVPSASTARFSWTIDPGYPIPVVTLTKVSGPGKANTLAADVVRRLRRGQTTGTITVTRGPGPGGSTVLQLTATNAAGSSATTARSTAW